MKTNPKYKALKHSPAFPAGDYWVIDPCYVVPDADWSQVCDMLYPDTGIDDKVLCSYLSFENIPFFINGTAYGDGEYPLYNVKTQKLIGTMCVDAGLLAIIPVGLVAQWDKGNEVKRLGQMVSLDKETKVYARGGDFDFGDYQVITSGADDDSYSEDDNE